MTHRTTTARTTWWSQTAPPLTPLTVRHRPLGTRLRLMKRRSSSAPHCNSGCVAWSSRITVSRSVPLPCLVASVRAVARSPTCGLRSVLWWDGCGGRRCVAVRGFVVRGVCQGRVHPTSALRVSAGHQVEDATAAGTGAGQPPAAAVHCGGRHRGGSGAPKRVRRPRRSARRRARSGGRPRRIQPAAVRDPAALGKAEAVAGDGGRGPPAPG